ncbi:hypothetical protein L1077_07385 [Pseudoalteromonas luteoviolacea]|uniref:Uncharacterized protein n=1 Tax=Pseudoalteromonas luteoviolacea H33 TaxID=1365251 RepID=A0A167C0I9_9GAMM|nr:hypothetical protein [Pseudoalteromonas luteoviolacea]KZN47105.1 hypothetical protein N476_23980 [Pseudoalteromonas luteoviolacea H33]KZN77554.1 hypothetical protein N477_12320 [Pseudoalteromonas luteoviolacea H33-S]MCF6439247.1 hypothetical protein [Pseudoalteromonas luteoviolacea]
MNTHGLLMVLFEALALKQERYYYQNILFTGMAISHTDGVVTSRHVYKNGVKEYDYEPPYLNKTTHVILDDLVDCTTDEPMYLNGERYTGTIYGIYPKGRVSSEDVFVRGMHRESTHYHYNSTAIHELVIESIVNEQFNTVEIHEWDSNGQLEYWDAGIESIKGEIKGRILFRLNEDFSIRVFTISGHFNKVLENSESLTCPYFLALKQVRQLNSEPIHCFDIKFCEQLWTHEPVIKQLIEELQPEELAISDFSSDCLSLIQYASKYNVNRLEVFGSLEAQDRESLTSFITQQCPHIELIIYSS